MQYSDSYNDVFLMARVCVREEIMAKYRLFTTLTSLNQYIKLYYIEESADLLTTYNELTGTSLFFRFRDFKN